MVPVLWYTPSLHCTALVQCEQTLYFLHHCTSSTNTIVQRRQDLLQPGLWTNLIFPGTNSGLEDTEKEAYCAFPSYCPRGTCTFMRGCSSFPSFFWQKVHQTTTPQLLPRFNQSSKHQFSIWKPDVFRGRFANAQIHHPAQKYQQPFDLVSLL